MWKKKQEDVELVVEQEEKQEVLQESDNQPKSSKKQKDKKPVTVKVQFPMITMFGKRYEKRTTYELTKEEFKRLKTTSFKYTVV